MNNNEATLEKLDRMAGLYAREQDVPRPFSDRLQELRRRLEKARTAHHGADVLPPGIFGA